MKTIEIKCQKDWDELPDNFEEFTVLKIISKETIIITSNPNNSRAELWDNSSAALRGNSSAALRDNSSAELYDSSSAELWDSNSALLYGNSRAELWDNSSTITNESATVHNYSSATKIKSYDNSTIYCHKMPKELITEESVNVIREIITPTFDQWLERGMVVADGIRQKLISKKSLGEITIYETEDFNKKRFFVAQKGDKFAHAETVEEAKKDLRYKISDRDLSYYEDWKLEDTKATDELIEAYRVITGACSTGTKLFCESKQLKELYTISEVIELTKDSYGNNKFAEFFKKQQ